MGSFFFISSLGDKNLEELVIDALLPQDVPSEAFDWILSHLNNELDTIVTKRTFEPVSNADVLIFAQMASFLNISLSNDEKSSSIKTR